MMADSSRLARMTVSVSMVALAMVQPVPAPAQTAPPIIDMHIHARVLSDWGTPPFALCMPAAPFPTWDPTGRPYREVWTEFVKNPPCSDPVRSPATDEALLTETLERLERFNIIGVLSSRPGPLGDRWMSAAPDRFIRSLALSAPYLEGLTPDSMRSLLEGGDYDVIGEVTTQYSGVEPGSDLLAPYFDVAAELDTPVGIHVGPTPPGWPALGSGTRARLHSPLTLEPVLERHPTLRVFIMHAGWPMLDDLIALLYSYPHVYVEIGAILFSAPQAEFDRILRGIVDAGFGTRVMFGSDGMVFPEVIDRTIAAVEAAPYLNAEQRRDIFYNNAARFLRLDEATIAAHHGRDD